MVSLQQNYIPHSKPWLTAQDADQVTKVLMSGQLVSGPQCMAFEKALTTYVNGVAGFSTTSGTNALILALKALDILPGDEVILPTYVCSSVQRAVESVGAKPILCDIGAGWNMTLGTVSQVRTDKTKAIIAVHIFGIPANIADIQTLGIPIIEDCCQALGSQWQKKMTGSQGLMSIFSFHATKCITTGEGGMLIINDETLMDKIINIRQACPLISPLSDLQASLGRSQLERYHEGLERRKKIAAQYFSRLPRLWTEGFSDVCEGSNYFRFLLNLTTPFDSVQAACEAEGIAVRKGVDALLHRMSKMNSTAFPNAEKAFSRTFSIPIHPDFSLETVEMIATKIQEAVERVEHHGNR